MATEDVYDVVVVGAGIMGSATAYTLARQGKRVLLLEQFSVPHSRGSSHGQSRIIRRAYAQAHYARMMPEAYDLWHDIERQSGETLIKEVGLLLVAPTSTGEVDRYCSALQSIQSPHDRLTSDQLRQRFPAFRMGPEYGGVYDPSGGLTRADTALRALQTLFKAKGGVFYDETRVTQIIPGEITQVLTTRGTFRGRSTVLTAGPWTGKLTTDLGLSLPLEPVRILVCYWRARRPGACDADAPFPAFMMKGLINSDGQRRNYYGLPAYEYPGCAKICLHGGPAIDPDFRDETKENWDLEALRDLVKNHFPDCEDEPVITEKCIYTLTPDEEIIVDSHPVWKNIVIGAGFSGSGFKLAPVIGRLLGQLALGEKPAYELTPFRLSRFAQQPKSHI